MGRLAMKDPGALQQAGEHIRTHAWRCNTFVHDKPSNQSLGTTELNTSHDAEKEKVSCVSD